ncbi:DAK2 domain-containing protein [Tengunoibacter tsumagoiensis]|uniref:Dihydroxyacetone kinase n=1 Tax=Tengunoibacter tsumagoiensis TaxID=2014871 RepID=A0A402A5B6_9CHLR|nr:DAK2 domain-containing protein [Tengunoibacter tsumagoiensis]GCE14300.1 dihydroxyacetone kinase [Tengunoibacter tsumagoiensis]
MEEKLSPTKRQRARRISVFDGQDLRKAILAGAAWLEENREYINALNVFPVPDGDTGSNMAATMKSAIRNIVNSEETSAGVIASKVAHDALLGARGNSGVILSQTLRGIAAGLRDKATFTPQDLSDAFQQASTLAYRAVIKPVEGTILTVVRETAEGARRSAERGDDFVALMQEIVNAARQSVARTPDLLPTLKQAGVVDAGGQGFCTILEGILRYVRGESTAHAPITSLPTPAEHQKKGRVTIEEEFGYEVVFLLHGSNLDVETIRQTIIDMGGVSTVVAGDEKLLKVHTHTPTPGKILDYGVSLGSLLDINIENLQEQSLTYAAESQAEHADEDAPTEIPPIAVVAVVAGNGFEKVFQGLGVSAIVSGGQTMNPSIEELLAAVEKLPSPQVIILPNNSNVVLSAQQVTGLSKKEVYVVPCKTLPQGISALMSFKFEEDFASNCQSMTEAIKQVQTAEITTAVRTVQLGGVNVREGDYIGVINGNLAVAGQELSQVIYDTLQRMQIDQYEIVTLYYGKEISLTEAQQLAKELKSRHSQLEIEVVDGGQPYYAYTLSVE